MENLVYGKLKQLKFESKQEKYIAIGFLAKTNMRLYIEDNDISLSGGEEAWAKEWRISFTTIPSNAPQSIKDSIKPNKDGSNPRLNNKQFINDLLKSKHKFKLGETQNIEDIKSTIPQSFIDYFNIGLEL